MPAPTRTDPRSPPAPGRSPAARNRWVAARNGRWVTAEDGRGVAGVDIVAVVSAERGVRPGDVVTLHFPLEKIHLFDAATELSVRRTRVG